MTPKKLIFCLTTFACMSTFAQESFGVYLGTNSVIEKNSVEHSYNAFIPFVNKKNFITFVDLRKISNDGVSISLGSRLVNKKNVILGLNSSYQSGSDNYGQNQKRINLGVEVLSKNFDARLNFYKGVGKGNTSFKTQEVLTPYLDEEKPMILKDSVIEYRSQLDGITYEFGKRFQVSKTVELGAYVGGEHYFKSGYSGVNILKTSLQGRKSFSNKKGTLSGNINAELALEKNLATSAYTPYVGLGLNLKLSGRKSRRRAKEKAMMEVDNSVVNHHYRNTMYSSPRISNRFFSGSKTVHNQTRVNAVVNIHGIDYTSVTETSADQDFINVIENAQNNSLIVLNGESVQNFIVGENSLNVNDSTALISGGTPVLFVGPNGEKAIYVLNGSDANIITSGNGDVVLEGNSQLVNIGLYHIDGEISGDNNGIINGSFEYGHSLTSRWNVFENITGWQSDTTLDGAAHFELQHGTLGGISASDGQVKLELDSHTRNGSGSETTNSIVYQDVGTKSNQTYRVTVDYTARVAGDLDTNQVGLYINDELVKVMNSDQVIWETQEYVFNATSDVTRVEFRGMGEANTYGGLIDNVRMEQVAVGN